ncbi:acyl-[ACP]--phospholipid O-acyltransferase [Kiloniella laminariae]|uniref:Acyl-[ACP]--phospholipid O-acyltransferase n=1 Tax=Kiloniella laminariae TaxID=454162 RepID=A0ABT4LIE2_9PROT|nr:acyl-[ACP]--phospholipid O-acyltransferase [Kiloniella laminariae]MCZ4280865.1 acyl-[ACP]--phospholipid O-acyltransferase [Kiloniella laminariae]
MSQENNNLLHLLKSRRFLPLFLTQALGALNDNVFKNALVILITYQVAANTDTNAQVMVTLAAGLFILPFFLFSAFAGQLADKYEKSRLIRIIKLCEIPIMGLAAVGFITEAPNYLMLVLFLMGSQSTFFGPLKYGILPDHMEEQELIGANGLIEAGTFLSILIGTIIGGIVILFDNGSVVISGLIISLAIIGAITSYGIPKAKAGVPDLKINPNFVGETWNLIKHSAGNRPVFLSILGISWFWLIGATFLTQFPNFAKVVIGGDEYIVTLFLTVFSVGIAIGSLLCNKLLKGEISARYVPFGAIGLSLFTFDLFAASSGIAPAHTALIGLEEFFTSPMRLRVLVDLLLISISGGIYIVPLYAILQSESQESHRARNVASNNILNSLFMVASAIVTLGLFSMGVNIPQVFLIIGLLNLPIVFYICTLLPEAPMKLLFRILLKLCFRVEVKGIENMDDLGPKAVIVVNHVSFLDGILLASFLPGRSTFAIDTHVAQRWWVKPFLAVVDAYPIDPTNPMATKTMIRVVKDGKRCVIFPEGRITVTGGMMKIYEGPGMIADHADAPLLPVHIEGAQYSTFSRLKGKVRRRWFPKITITVHPPRRITVDQEVKGRDRRAAIGRELHDIMSETAFVSSHLSGGLFNALLDARDIHGGDCKVVEDVERRPLNYDRLIAASFVLGKKFASFTSHQEIVGLLLPNSCATTAAFFALQSQGRIAAMLNFTMGEKNLLSCCSTGKIKTIITSRRFIELGRLDQLAEALETRCKLVYLEDIKQEVTLLDKLTGAIKGTFARLVHRKLAPSFDDAAVVLFTSGSEGVPKGVMLSHGNLLSNRHQLASVIDFNSTDTVFNALPVFHSFGLTGGLILPVLSGIKSFLYPSPLHYRIVPALVYDCNATIIFGTDTFLSGYARVAHPYDFYSIRYIFAGAEKVKESTRKTWADKFGLRILEGYGATETSPVLSTNTPLQFKAGTVGRFLPGLEIRLEEVPGITDGRRLFVKGPNIMKGYLRSDAPGELQPPEDGWYDTGDIVALDEDDFISIKGRAKRFAKIAGEMVSLTAAEDLASKIWPGFQHAVITRPDARKGEQLILATDCPKATRSILLAMAQEQGISELMIPREVEILDKLPVLGTGKTDYQSLQQQLVSETAS